MIDFICDCAAPSKPFICMMMLAVFRSRRKIPEGGGSSHVWWLACCAELDCWGQGSQESFFTVFAPPHPPALPLLPPPHGASDTIIFVSSELNHHKPSLIECAQLVRFLFYPNTKVAGLATLKTQPGLCFLQSLRSVWVTPWPLCPLQLSTLPLDNHDFSVLSLFERFSSTASLTMWFRMMLKLC